jgi:GntR family transcriptional regulator
MPADQRRSTPALQIELDPRLRMPVYLQIVAQIRQQADAGRLRAGAQLPTVRHLARRLGVNFNTVARAYRLLAQEGRLSTQPGRGSFMLERRKPGNAALRTLARDFVSRTRNMRFEDGWIEQAVRRELRRQPFAPPPGDNHE